MAHRGFADDGFRRLAGGFPRARRQNHAADQRFGDALIFVQKVFQGRAQGVVHEPLHLGIIEPFFGLSLKLRVQDEHAQDAGHALADVFRLDAEPFRREVVRLHILTHGFHDAVPQA